MSSRPWFAWFPSDYRAKTAHLTYLQDAAYRRLLDAYYERRGPLPANASALYRLASAMTDEERQAVNIVANEFFTNGDGLLKNARCDAQIEKESALQRAWVEGGRKGGLRQAQGRLKRASSIPDSDSDLDLHLNLDSKPKRKSKAQAPFVLPDWIPEEQWNAWIEARVKIRKPATDYAKRVAVLKLDNLREQGHPPAQVLMQSAINSWQGLFPPKEIK